MRYLMGYTQDIGKDFNATPQYYVEQMLDYDEYRKNLDGGYPRDHWRHVVTLQLDKKTDESESGTDFVGILFSQ